MAEVGEIDGINTAGIVVANTVLGSARSVQVISYNPFVADIAPRVTEVIGQTTGSDTIARGAVALVEMDTF